MYIYDNHVNLYHTKRYNLNLWFGRWLNRACSYLTRCVFVESRSYKRLPVVKSIALTASHRNSRIYINV